MPLDAAVVRIDRNPGRGVQVIPWTQVRIPGRRVTGAEEQGIGFRIVGAAQPGCRAAGLPHVTRPGFAGLATGNTVLDLLAVLVDIAHVAFYCRAGPQQITGVGVVGFNLTHDTEFTTRHAGNQLAVDHDGRGCDGVALLIIGNLLDPDHLTGVFIERDQLGIQSTEVNLVTINGSAPVDHVTAGHNAVWQAGVVLPQFLTGAGVYCPHAGVGTGHIHHAVFDQRLRFLATLFLSTEGERPRWLEIFNVFGVQGFHRAVALALIAHAVGHDTVDAFMVVQQVLVGDRVGPEGNG